MTFDPDKHHRRSIRLKGYDYAQPGAYFVTICTFQRQCLFGDVADGELYLGEFGHIVLQCWGDLVNHYPNVILDVFITMPNHVHGIVVLGDAATERPVGAGLKPALPTPAPTKLLGLPEIVRGFKSFSSRRINETRNTPGVPVWQRNYYEHVIRDAQELDAVRHYISDNPAKWARDMDNPANMPWRRREGGFETRPYAT